MFGTGPGAVVAVHGTSCVIEARPGWQSSGPSGSGKSTLLHLIAGLEQPTVGSVTWPGLPLAPDRAFEIGVVFQSPSLVPALTVEENTALPLILAAVLGRGMAVSCGRGAGRRGVGRSRREASGGICLGVRVNESRSPGCSLSGRDSSWPMNPPGSWTAPAGNT